MTSFDKYKGKLFKMALITSPLIGSYSLIPMFLYIGSSESLRLANDIDLDLPKILLGLFTASTSIFLQWLINIALLRYIPRLNHLNQKQQNWLRYISAYLLTFLLALIMITVRNKVKPLVDVGYIQYYPFLGAFTSTTFILLLINLIIARNEKSELELEKAQLEISHLLTQQEQLKQQIHPHFLFNAMATLQILIDVNPGQAKVYSSKLVNYLRASLTLAKKNLITIQEDMTFMVNYLELQQVRFKDSIHHKIDIPESILLDSKLPIFSLQILAENAIKHNAFSEERPLSISIVYENGLLFFTNNKIAKFKTVDSTKIGLTNLIERFKHFTTELPVITDTATTFSVKLKVLEI